MKAFVWIYVALIGVFALYGTWFGDSAYRSFAYHLGRAFVWPTILFPSLGAALGGLAIIAFVGWLTILKKQ